MNPPAYVTYRCPKTNVIRTVGPNDYDVQHDRLSPLDETTIKVNCLCGVRHELSCWDGLL
jgi:hypothetical protein